MEACSKALAVLISDEAHELFAKTFNSALRSSTRVQSSTRISALRSSSTRISALRSTSREVHDSGIDNRNVHEVQQLIQEIHNNQRPCRSQPWWGCGLRRCRPGNHLDRWGLFLGSRLVVAWRDARRLAAASDKTNLMCVSTMSWVVFATLFFLYMNVLCCNVIDHDCCLPRWFRIAPEWF